MASTPNIPVFGGIMGLFTDILKGLPENAVLREKVAAAEDKYAALETENAILKDDIREAKMLIDELKHQVSELRKKDDNLDELELKLLQLVANTDYGDAVADALFHGFEVSLARFDYHLERLRSRDYIRSGIIDHRGVHYEVTQRGRSVLLEKDML